MEVKPVVAVGGMNVDLVSKTHRFPRAGETVIGESFYKGFGGKAANQAVQVARLNVPVHFIGSVGDDAFGKEMIACMRDQGIGTAHMKVAKGFPSGTAMIFVDSEAQNEIVVVSGANDELGPRDIQEAEDIIAGAAVVVVPFDIPFATVRETVRIAIKHDVPVIVNPAPVLLHEVEPSFLKQVAVLVPNETEAEALTGVKTDAPGFAETAACSLGESGARTVIVTLGEKGSLLSDSDAMTHVAAFEVQAEDTTAAGDAFVGALAAGYQFFSELPALARFASATAALAVTRQGAQSSLPQRWEVEDFLEEKDPALLEQVREKMQQA